MKKILTAIGIIGGSALLFWLSKSKIFFGNLTDDELAEGRERVRLKLFEGIDVYGILRKFDDEIRRRDKREPGYPKKKNWYFTDDD